MHARSSMRGSVTRCDSGVPNVFAHQPRAPLRRSSAAAAGRQYRCTHQSLPDWAHYSAKVRMLSSRCMPHCTDDHLATRHVHRIVDVISATREQDSAQSKHSVRIARCASPRKLSQSIDRRPQLLVEQAWRCRSLAGPPLLNGVGVRRRIRGEENNPSMPTHACRCRRNRRSTASAGIRRPSLTSRSDCSSDCSSRRRDSSSRSSHQSAGTKSISAPSGRSVASSSTSRPFWTRAFIGAMNEMVARSERSVSAGTTNPASASREWPSNVCGAEPRAPLRRSPAVWACWAVISVASDLRLPTARLALEPAGSRASASDLDHGGGDQDSGQARAEASAPPSRGSPLNSKEQDRSPPACKEARPSSRSIAPLGQDQPNDDRSDPRAGQHRKPGRCPEGQSLREMLTLTCSSEGGIRPTSLPLTARSPTARASASTRS